MACDYLRAVVRTCLSPRGEDGKGTAEDCGNLDMVLFWEVGMFAIFLYVIVLLPMAIFHYEAFDEVEVRAL